MSLRPKDRMNKTFVIVIGALTAVLVILLVSQIRLAQRVDKALAGMPMSQTDPPANSATADKVDALQRQVELLEKKLAETRQLDSLENRSPVPQPLPPRSRMRPVQPVMPNIAFPPGLPRVSNPTRRLWSPEQVIGPPDTMQAGDMGTAWASGSPDGGVEWLKVDYLNDVTIAEVRVRETYNPGAIIKIAAVLADGTETLIWKGEEPRAEAPVDRTFEAIQGNVRAKSVKIYLDTQKVPGWNEIDAVELIGTDGSRQWASQASASSTYADVSAPIAR